MTFAIPVSSRIRRIRARNRDDFGHRSAISSKTDSRHAGCFAAFSTPANFPRPVHRAKSNRPYFPSSSRKISPSASSDPHSKPLRGRSSTFQVQSSKFRFGRLVCNPGDKLSILRREIQSEPVKLGLLPGYWRNSMLTSGPETRRI